jgi:hypothetical protein
MIPLLIEFPEAVPLVSFPNTVHGKTRSRRVGNEILTKYASHLRHAYLFLRMKQFDNSLIDFSHVRLILAS